MSVNGRETNDGARRKKAVSHKKAVKKSVKRHHSHTHRKSLGSTAAPTTNFAGNCVCGGEQN